MCNDIPIIPNHLKENGQHSAGRRKSAFTLAEVLITLGIIGVVAAMTLPNLVASYNNNITEIRLKKFYSIFNQAIQYSIVDNGDTSTWDYWLHDQLDEDGNLINRTDESDVIFKKYLKPYMKIIEEKDIIDKDNQKRHLYYLADGSAFAYVSHENRDVKFYPKNAEKCLIQVDNNKLCSFSFEFYPIDTSLDWFYLYKKGLEPSLYAWNGETSALYTGATYSCSSSINNTYCTAIIARNGWKIPKDFPVKIKY